MPELPGTKIATGLEETDNRFAFCLAYNGDLFAIKKRDTGTNSTEIHVLSAASDYKDFVTQTGTALPESGEEFDFLLAANRDLIAIKKNGTGSGTTEAHILSAASNYQELILQTATALHETDSSFAFGVGENRDLFAIKKSNTGSHSTEVHVLAAVGNYQELVLQTGTVLGETDGTFEFAVAPNRDLFVIKKSQTGTQSTEVHILSAASAYKEFVLQTGTELPESDETVVHAVTPARHLLAIRKQGGASFVTEVQLIILAFPPPPPPPPPVTRAAKSFKLPTNVIDQGQAQQRTLWLPEDGQTHDVGNLSGSVRLEWITTRVGTKQGVLGRSGMATLPPGDYRAIVQIYHKQNAGKQLGQIQLRDGAGAMIASSIVVSQVFPKFENGGYQRATLDFTIPTGDASARQRQIEFVDFANHTVWLGAISVRMKGTPVYVMGHHANSALKASLLMNAGARVIECDIHPDFAARAETDFKLWIIHFFADEGSPALHTNPGQVDAYFQNIKLAMDQGRLDLLLLDCKSTFVVDAGVQLIPDSFTTPDSRKYGRSLANLMKKHGIPPERVVIGYDEDKVAELIRGAAEVNYRCGVDVYASPGSGYTDFEAIRKWADILTDRKCLFADLGKDEAVRGEFPRYAYWLAELLRRRDEGIQIKKVYFWTVNNADSWAKRSLVPGQNDHAFRAKRSRPPRTDRK